MVKGKGRPKKTIDQYEADAEISIGFQEAELQCADVRSNEDLQKRIKILFHRNNIKLARMLCIKLILRKYKIVTEILTDKILAFNEELGYYHPIGEELIKSFLTENISVENTTSNSREILHLLRTKTYISDAQINETTPLKLIPFKNGVYNLETHELMPHSPEYLFTFQIPTKFNPKAECPQIDKFISEIVQPEHKTLIYDIFALCLYRQNFIEKIFVLTGIGQNGKSRLLKLLEMFIGIQNKSSITLKQMTEDRFSVAGMYKKLANIAPDIGSSTIYDTEILKSASSIDSISGQFKFGQIFDFLPTATLIFGANNPPKFIDDSVGIYRRIEQIPFPYSFGNDADIAENPNTKKADPHILDKITTEEEMSGLLNIALKHLEKIKEQGQLSVVRSAKTSRNNYVMLSDPVKSFLEINCEEAEYTPAEHGKEKIPATGYELIGTLYEEFKIFCKKNGLQVKSRDWFSKQIKKVTDWNLEFGQQDYVDITIDQPVRERSVRGLVLKPDRHKVSEKLPQQEVKETADSADTPQLSLNQDSKYKINKGIKKRLHVSDVSDASDDSYTEPVIEDFDRSGVDVK